MTHPTAHTRWNKTYLKMTSACLLYMYLLWFLLFLNWAVLYGTAVAAVTSAAWTLAFFYRESTDIRDQLETIVLLSALVAGPVIVFTAEHLVFSIWMAIQILTGLYWVHTTGKLKKPSVQLSPKGVMQQKNDF